MTPLEKIQSMKMPFAELKGVTFVAADKDRVVAQMGWSTTPKWLSCPRVRGRLRR